MERLQGALDGVQRGPVGLPGPLELAALVRAVVGKVRGLAHVEVLVDHVLITIITRPARLHRPARPRVVGVRRVERERVLWLRRLGFGRIVVSEIEAPNLLVNMV